MLTTRSQSVGTGGVIVVLGLENDAALVPGIGQPHGTRLDETEVAVDPAIELRRTADADEVTRETMTAMSRTAGAVRGRA